MIYKCKPGSLRIIKKITYKQEICKIFYLHKSNNLTFLVCFYGCVSLKRKGRDSHASANLILLSVCLFGELCWNLFLNLIGGVSMKYLFLVMYLTSFPLSSLVIKTGVFTQSQASWWWSADLCQPWLSSPKHFFLELWFIDWDIRGSTLFLMFPIVKHHCCPWFSSGVLLLGKNGSYFNIYYFLFLRLYFNSIMSFCPFFSL